MNETTSALALDPWAKALWRSGNAGSESQASGRLAAWVLTAVATCQQQGRLLLHSLVAAGETALHGTAAPSLLPARQGG